MLWTGLFQAWDTFAPLPKSQNDYVQGVVITRDGQNHIWNFPRMEQLSFFQRYSKERYRKFAESLPAEKNAAAWPDVARHLAQGYKNPLNPAEIVLLIRYWSPIVPEAYRSYGLDRQRAKIFFEYNVTPKDLN